MQQSSKKYALILESRGFYKEALEIYKDLQTLNPSDSSIKDSIERLKFKLYKKIDPKKKSFFVKMRTEKDFLKFEKWLSKL